MKYSDIIKLTPAQQEAYWKSAQEKAARRSNT